MVMSEEQYVQGRIVRLWLGVSDDTSGCMLKKGTWFCIKLSVVPIPPLMVPPENV